MGCRRFCYGIRGYPSGHRVNKNEVDESSILLDVLLEGRDFGFQGVTNVVCVEVGSKPAGGAAGEKDVLRSTEVVVLHEVRQDGVEDASATKVKWLAADHHSLIPVAREGVAVAVRHVDTVKVAEIWVVCLW